MIGVVAITGFATLYLASRVFAMDVNFGGLDHETVHNAGHIFVYGTLSVLLAKAMGNRFLLAWVISNLLAGGEEFYQSFVPGRVSSLDDALLNFVSISVFLLAGWLRAASTATNLPCK